MIIRWSEHFSNLIMEWNGTTEILFERNNQLNGFIVKPRNKPSLILMSQPSDHSYHSEYSRVATAIIHNEDCQSDFKRLLSRVWNSFSLSGLIRLLKVEKDRNKPSFWWAINNSMMILLSDCDMNVIKSTTKIESCWRKRSSTHDLDQ
jgi:hypothetical protein